MMVLGLGRFRYRERELLQSELLWLYFLRTKASKSGTSKFGNHWSKTFPRLLSMQSVPRILSLLDCRSSMMRYLARHSWDSLILKSVGLWAQASLRLPFRVLPGTGVVSQLFCHWTLITLSNCRLSGFSMCKRLLCKTRSGRHLVSWWQVRSSRFLA